MSYRRLFAGLHVSTGITKGCLCIVEIKGVQGCSLVGDSLKCLISPFCNIQFKIIKKIWQNKMWIEADIPCINFITIGIMHSPQPLAWSDKQISYSLSREYRVARDRYSRLSFTSDDRFCANLCVQQQSTNMTSCQYPMFEWRHRPTVVTSQYYIRKDRP